MGNSEQSNFEEGFFFFELGFACDVALYGRLQCCILVLKYLLTFATSCLEELANFFFFGHEQ